MSTDKPRVLVSAEEEADISRMLMIWINTFSDEEMLFVNYEFLAADSAGMALSTIPGTYITRRYILGGHEAEYQFKIIARIIPGNGASNGKRLNADALLNRLGDWAVENYPDLGKNIHVRRVEIASRAAMFAKYKDGTEDHQILMKLTYEVK